MAQVSVIIPTYNRAGKVARAIASVLYQTFTDCEVIVVDDGSTDSTADTLSLLDSHLIVIRHEQNRGVSAARNTGIKAASAPLVAFLDSDDYWLPEKLGLQAAFFQSRPDAVACQTQELWIRKGRRVNPAKKHLKPRGNIFEPSLKLCLVSPSAVVVRRALFDEVGFFDETFPVCEDYDLWLRISCRYPVDLIDRSLVIKEGGHMDQLSKSMKGMDRFRIQAMAKLLQEGCLTQSQVLAVFTELKAKCDVYGLGCLKRGRKDEGQYYLELPFHLRSLYGQKT